MLKGDAAPRIVGISPCIDWCNRPRIESSILHENADEGMGDALGHRPRQQRSVGTGIRAVSLGDDTAFMDDDECVRFTKAGVGFGSESGFDERLQLRRINMPGE